MVDLTTGQKDVLKADGPLLVIGGPGSGKTTVSILKAAQIAGRDLGVEQRVLFLSFARATVSRVMEAIDEEKGVAAADRKRIEVDTYHAFFWRLLKTHGYLVGLPRRLSILAPAAEAIALAPIRSRYPRGSQITEAQAVARAADVEAERRRLAFEEGRVAFSLFADLVWRILDGSQRVRDLVALRYPAIILDEFQDTSGEQWCVVQALGRECLLIALADPEQRIFDFIGADPERLDHFREAFTPKEFDLSTDNHRSKGTEIALFGNDVLTGRFRQTDYTGLSIVTFAANHNQAFGSLVGRTLHARRRLIDAGRKDWSLAVLVPTKQMTRMVSDAFRSPVGAMAAIQHTAAVDMEGPVLAAEMVAFLLEQGDGADHFDAFVVLLANFFNGRGGDKPTQGNMTAATQVRTAGAKWREREAVGKPVAKNNILIAAYQVALACRALALTGDPDRDWVAVRQVVEDSPCPRMREIGQEVRNIRLLERGTQLRQALAQDWRDHGRYLNALEVTRHAFIQEHFASAQRPESGVVVMNMHKAKGKQFDEVIIFEGWPVIARGQIMANPNRIVRGNILDGPMTQARQNFRVSVTRAKSRTTIMTPVVDRCVLLPPT